MSEQPNDHRVFLTHGFYRPQEVFVISFQIIVNEFKGHLLLFQDRQMRQIFIASKCTTTLKVTMMNSAMRLVALSLPQRLGNNIGDPV